MLGHSRHADLLFEVNDISAYVAFMLEGFGYEGLALPGVLGASKVLEHGFIWAQKHLEFVNVDCLWRHGISPDVGAHDNAERVLADNGLI